MPSAGQKQSSSSIEVTENQRCKIRVNHTKEETSSYLSLIYMCTFYKNKTNTPPSFLSHQTGSMPLAPSCMARITHFQFSSFALMKCLCSEEDFQGRVGGGGGEGGKGSHSLFGWSGRSGVSLKFWPREGKEIQVCKMQRSWRVF